MSAFITMWTNEQQGTLLCPNCHKMIHKRKPDPFTPDELRAQLRRV